MRAARDAKHLTPFTEALRMAESSKNNAAIRARGFSIFELITVVVILGILAAMLGPAMSRIIRHNRVKPRPRPSSLRIFRTPLL